MQSFQVDLTERRPWTSAIVRGLDAGLDANYLLDELINAVPEHEMQKIATQWYYDNCQPVFVVKTEGATA